MAPAIMVVIPGIIPVTSGSGFSLEKTIALCLAKRHFVVAIQSAWVAAMCCDRSLFLYPLIPDFG
jgi:hypothetical protein